MINSSTRSKNFYLFLTLLLVLTTTSYGQSGSEFITATNVNFDELTDLQREHYYKLEAHDYVTQMWFVNVADLKASQSEGYLWLTLPDKDCSARLKALHVESSLEDGGDYNWYGQVRPEEENEACTSGELPDDEHPCVCDEGMMSLIMKDGQMVGHIQIDEDKYDLFDLGNEYRVLVKKDFPELEQTCLVKSSGGDEIREEHHGTEKAAQVGTNCPVKIVALYTPNAAAAMPGIVNVISMDFFQANQALRNSAITASQVTYALDAILPLDFTEGTLMETDGVTPGDIDLLIANQDLQDLKDNRDADIIIVFTDGEYTDAVGNVGEIFPTNPDDAVGMVQIDGAIGRFTTAHEIGHIMGARHSECIGNGSASGFPCDPDGTFGHAHSIKKGWGFFTKHYHTILLAGQSKRKFLNYSNPAVNYKNKPTGIANSRDNARMIRTNVCTVSDYERDANIPTLTTTIDGAGFVCPCWFTSVSSNNMGGVPPYSNKWWTSTDGFNWGNVVGTGGQIGFSIPCTEGDGIYVRLEVTSSDNQTALNYKFVESARTWPGQQGPCPRNDHGNENQFDEADIQAFPNPFNHSFTVVHPVQDSNVTLRVFDKLGKLIQSKTIAAGSSSQTVFDTAHLPVGIYVVEIETKDKTFTRKLAKL